MTVEIETLRAKIQACKTHRQLLTVENNTLRKKLLENATEKRRYKDIQHDLERELQRLERRMLPSLFNEEGRAADD